MARCLLALSGMLSLGLSTHALAADTTQVVARDVRPLGNGSCAVSVAVRYAEPIQSPWSSPSRLLKTARKTVPCSQALPVVDLLVRNAESELLIQAQRRSDDDNAHIRSVKLTDSATIYTQASDEARELKVLPAGTRIYVRSVTPTWYGITDAHGYPTYGFVHYSQLSGQLSAANAIQSSMTSACNSRVRAEPSSDGRVLDSLPCGAKLQVIAASGGWYELVSNDGAPSGRYIHGAVLKPVGVPGARKPSKGKARKIKPARPTKATRPDSDLVAAR